MGACADWKAVLESVAPREDCARRRGPDAWIRDRECGERRPGVRADYCDQRNPLGTGRRVETEAGMGEGQKGLELSPEQSGKCSLVWSKRTGVRMFTNAQPPSEY